MVYGPVVRQTTELKIKYLSSTGHLQVIKQHANYPASVTKYSHIPKRLWNFTARGRIDETAFTKN
jgi:hypothetical protein